MGGKIENFSDVLMADCHIVQRSEIDLAPRTCLWIALKLEIPLVRQSNCAACANPTRSEHAPGVYGRLLARPVCTRTQMDRVGSHRVVFAVLRVRGNRRPAGAASPAADHCRCGNRSGIGSVRARLRGVAAATRETAVAFEQVVLRALEETENALVAYREDQQRLVRLNEQARESARAASIARVRYREGAADFLVLLDAERTQLQAEDAVAQAEAGVFTSVIALLQSPWGIPGGESQVP